MNKRHPQGLTMIEMLLYVGILAILGTLLSSFLLTSLQVRVKAESIAEVEDQGFASMQVISRIVREATAVDAPVSGQSGSELQLTTADPPTTPTTITAVDGQLILSQGSTSGALTSGVVVVDDLTITALGSEANPSYRIDLTLSRQNVSGRQEYTYVKTFTTIVALR